MGNLDNTMKYTAVIRTLGKAGDKYQKELDSLCTQTLPPEDIIVYIAEGYPLPKETCGKERYIRVSKGMVAQRALPYDEVKTEWILFLDDDVYLPPAGVEVLFNTLRENNAQVVAPDTFDNSSRSFKSELMMTITGRMLARRGDKKYGYKVMRTCGYSYNKSPKPQAYLSETNAGPCFLCKKEDFLKINFEEERWIDTMPYAMGEDEVMFYKMHLAGLKQMTLFGSGIQHLDAGSTLQNTNKERSMVEADYFFRKIFWTRFIQDPERNSLIKVWNKICIYYFYFFGLTVSLLKGDCKMFRRKLRSIEKARSFLKSATYTSIPKIIKK